MSEIKVYGLDSSLINDADPKDGFVVDVVRFSDYVELEKKYQELAGENAALTDKAASELSNSWLLHKYWVGIQVALMYIRAGKIDDATEWLVGTVSGPGIEAPDLIFTAEIESWAEIQQKDIISHAKAVEIIKAEMSATTQALNEIKAQGVDEFADNWQGKESRSQISEMARRFAASLRGEQNA